jgi:hypothetical protein
MAVFDRWRLFGVIVMDVLDQQSFLRSFGWLFLFVGMFFGVIVMDVLDHRPLLRSLGWLPVEIFFPSIE